ncbi:MAG: adenosylcobinamide amidohydrolase [Mycobacteriales bacterium]
MIASQLFADLDDGSGLPLLLWRFRHPMTIASTAASGGGLGLRHWVLNAQVPVDYARCDPEAHVDQLAGLLGLSGVGVGMLTAADVTYVQRSQDGGVSVEATVGLTHPTWAAAPDEGSAGDGAGRPGTVNIVAVVPVPLSHAGLLNALCTATEAKTQALLAAGIAGTGTASDAVTVICPPGVASEQFGGPRSTWGARLARGVHDAVRAGCTLPGYPAQGDAR